MATHGTLGEFDSSREDWTSYSERLEQYFHANDVVSPEKQRAILLSACNASTYQLIRDLVAPAKPTSKSFDELIKLVKDHHQPPPSASSCSDLTSTCAPSKKGRVSPHLWRAYGDCRSIVNLKKRWTTCYGIGSSAESVTSGFSSASLQSRT